MDSAIEIMNKAQKVDRGKCDCLLVLLGIVRKANFICYKSDLLDKERNRVEKYEWKVDKLKFRKVELENENSKMMEKIKTIEAVNEKMKKEIVGLRSSGSTKMIANTRDALYV